MKKLRLLIIIMLIFFLPLIVFKMVDNYFSERTQKYMEQAATYATSDIFSLAANIVANYNKDELIKYKLNEDAYITSVYVDTTNANKLLVDISNLISEQISSGIIEEKMGNVNIKLGQLLSSSLFTNVGPNIKIKTSPIYSYTTDIYTSTKESGINNTLVEVYIEAIINIEAFIPLCEKNICLKSKIYIINQVIQGKIPLYYFSGGIE